MTLPVKIKSGTGLVDISGSNLCTVLSPPDSLRKVALFSQISGKVPLSDGFKSKALLLWPVNVEQYYTAKDYFCCCFGYTL